MVSGTRCPYVSACGYEVVRGGERGSDPEGADDLCLVSFRDLGIRAGIWASKLGFGPQSWDLGLKVWIWATRQEIFASRLGFEPHGWDLGHKVGI